MQYNVVVNLNKTIREYVLQLLLSFTSTVLKLYLVKKEINLHYIIIDSSSDLEIVSTNFLKVLVPNNIYKKKIMCIYQLSINSM
jgi:hypothetical protein